jgi:hypothetical protein
MPAKSKFTDNAPEHRAVAGHLRAIRLPEVSTS